MTVWYEIQVQEHLDEHWAAWFDGLALSHGPDNSTLLRGPVADQSALYGLLDRARDLGLTLLSLYRVSEKVFLKERIDQEMVQCADVK